MQSWSDSVLRVYAQQEFAVAGGEDYAVSQKMNFMQLTGSGRLCMVRGFRAKVPWRSWGTVVAIVVSSVLRSVERWSRVVWSWLDSGSSKLLVRRRLFRLGKAFHGIPVSLMAPNLIFQAKTLSEVVSVPSGENNINSPVSASSTFTSHRLPTKKIFAHYCSWSWKASVKNPLRESLALFMGPTPLQVFSSCGLLRWTGGIPSIGKDNPQSAWGLWRFDRSPDV